MLWFTSDHHLLEKNIIKIDKRPYSSMEEMVNDYIVKWNYLIEPKDTVYHLGDFISQYTHINSVQKILRRLKGKRKILICGNHDEHGINWYRRAGFHEVVKDPILLKVPVDGKKQKILLSHVPCRGDFYLNVHGHNHNDVFLGISQNYNVAVHLHNGYPQSMNIILERYKLFKENNNGSVKE